MTQETISISTGTQTMPIWRFSPSSPGPLVVVVPSIFGLTPDVAHVATHFAEAGAVVYAMDPFWRDGLGALRIPQDSPKAIARKKMITDQTVLSDLLATCDAGQRDAHCNGQRLLLGICFGGRFAMTVGQQLGVDGIAIWHGSGLLPVVSPAALKGIALSMDFGAEDPLIPLSEVAVRKQRLAPHQPEIRVHADAGHGFTHWGSDRCVPAAAAASENGVIDMIKGLQAEA